MSVCSFGWKTRSRVWALAGVLCSCGWEQSSPRVSGDVILSYPRYQGWAVIPISTSCWSLWDRRKFHLGRAGRGATVPAQSIPRGPTQFVLRGGLQIEFLSESNPDLFFFYDREKWGDWSYYFFSSPLTPLKKSSILLTVKVTHLSFP